MEKNNKQNGSSMVCACENCQPSYYGLHSVHRHHLLRWLLGIVILLMTFSFGVKIGEFKAALESGYGDPARGMLWDRYYPVMMPQATLPSTTTNNSSGSTTKFK
jgi:hypothetical protein